MTLVYYLLIKNMQDLSLIFPEFYVFVLPAVLVGIPVTVISGWLHIKGTLAFASELDISIEANPYAYKVTPGLQKEVVIPLCLKMLQLAARVSKDRNLLTAEQESDVKDIEKKLRILLGGGIVGTPRRKMIQ